MRQILSKFLQPLKRIGMWATGQRELESQIATLQSIVTSLAARVEELDPVLRALATRVEEQVITSYQLSEKLDLTLRYVEEQVITSYQLSEKLDLTLRALATLENQSGSEVIADEIDRLDGYLIYQIGGVRAEIDRLHSALLDALTTHRPAPGSVTPA